jgi:hypothetical protein
MEVYLKERVPMAGIKFEMESPKTQSPEAVKALITYFNHGNEPADLPAFFRLSGDMVLVKSNKGDAYYVTTPKDCSCPARTYNPGKQCKHSRKYFPQPKLAQAREDSIRPTGGWIGPDGKRANGPVEA